MFHRACFFEAAPAFAIFLALGELDCEGSGVAWAVLMQVQCYIVQFWFSIWAKIELAIEFPPF